MSRGEENHQDLWEICIDSYQFFIQWLFGETITCSICKYKICVLAPSSYDAMHPCKLLLCASGHGPQARVLKTGKGPPPTTAINDLLLPWPRFQICPPNILAKPEIILRDVAIGFQGLALRAKSTSLMKCFCWWKSGMWTRDMMSFGYTHEV